MNKLDNQAIIDKFSSRIGGATIYYKSSLDNIEVSGFEAGMSRAAQVFEKNADVFIVHDSRDKGIVWQAGCIAVFANLIMKQKNGEFFSSYANGFNQGLERPKKFSQTSSQTSWWLHKWSPFFVSEKQVCSCGG